MLKAITQLLLIITLLFAHVSSQATEDYSTTLRAITEQADVILCFYASKQGTTHYQTLKNNDELASKFLKEVGYEIDMSHPKYPDMMYQIIFVRKWDWNTGYKILADHMNFRFKSKMDADFAIARITKLLEIQKITDQKEQTLQSMNWLIENMKLYQDAYQEPIEKYHMDGNLLIPWYFQPHQLYLDATSDLYGWEFDYDYENEQKLHFSFPDTSKTKEEQLKDEIDFHLMHYSFIDYTKGGDLSYISSSMQADIYTIFKKQAYPNLAIATFLIKLDYPNLERYLIQACFSGFKDDHIHKDIYALDLIKLNTTPNYQKQIARLLLFSLRDETVPMLESSQPYSQYRKEYLSYIAKVLDDQELNQVAQEWKETAIALRYEYKKHPDPKKLRSFITKAASQLAMCSDERISVLTGKKQYWECTNVSAFAQAEAFEEGSIELHVYPNPSNGNFTIQIALPEHEVLHIELRTLDGRLVIQKTLRKYDRFTANYLYNSSFHLEGLPKGVYLLNVQQFNKMLTQKIVVE